MKFIFQRNTWNLYWVVLALFWVSCSNNTLQQSLDDNSLYSVENIQTLPLPSHPRLLLGEGEEELVKKMLSEREYKKVHDRILSQSNAILSYPLPERVLEGRRMLEVSRESLKRIFFLSYAYRMTNEEPYLQRAEAEMLAVCGFSDWNPSHFLDVAEMTLAVAIGYDWLYHYLPEQSKAAIRTAIREKGLNPSTDSKYNGFLSSKNNWNQVCNAGVAFGALAVYEDDPSFSQSLIDRTVSSVLSPMKEYGKDGTYSDGYGYWGYGTTFNIMLLSVLEKNYQSDFGLLANAPGFLKTPQYASQMVAPSLESFNYSDAGSGTGVSPSFFWFARQTNDRSLLWLEKKQIERSAGFSYRLLPLLLIWGVDMPFSSITPPDQRVWVSGDRNAVAAMRSSWSAAKPIYVGFKAGIASVSHGHMDVGSFIMEASGVRWGVDLGSQDYNSLESLGLDIWNYGQQSDRWKVFRNNNHSHNTLTVNGELQQVGRQASFESHGSEPMFTYTIANLTPVYDKQINEWKRGIAIVDNSFVVVRDEVVPSANPATVKWTLVSRAEVQLKAANEVLLKQNNKTLQIKVESPSSIVIQVKPATGLYSYDEANINTSLITFECRMAPGSKQVIQVKLIPECTATDGMNIPDLSLWSR